MNYARQQDLFPGIENRLTYIAKLYDEEFHLLVRSDIKTVADLANQKVNVDLRGGGTEVTTTRLFSLLNIPIVMTNDDPGVALDKLRRGEIAALAQVSGTPAPIFRDLIGENNLHFLSVPLNPAVTAAYVLARLTADDYPALIQYNHPVDTVAAGAVLVAADLQPASDRYRNVVNFVDAFFTGFQSLLLPGHNPKWHEVNIAAELPGWRRFQPAADWLQRNAPSAAEPSVQALKGIFARFVDERQQAAGSVPLNQQQKDDLFTQFERWQKSPEPSNLACDVEACADFYHSFRASDCTYQPSGGGSRQVCTKYAPQSAQSRANAKTVAGSEEVHGQCNFAACSQTYSSFNPSDCTYQPYRSGRREFCKIALGWVAFHHQPKRREIAVKIPRRRTLPKS
jgi:hypothetical protein